MLKPIRTTIIGGEHLPDTRRDPCRRDQRGLGIAGDRQAGRGRLALEHGRRGGGRPRVGDRVAVLMLHRGAACPACAIARRAVGALEANVLSRFLPTHCSRTKTQSMLSADDIEGMSVVVVRCGATVRPASTAWGGSPSRSSALRRQVALSSCRARPIPGQARSASRRGTASHALDLPVAAVAGIVRRLGRGANRRFALALAGDGRHVRIVRWRKTLAGRP